MDVANFTQEQMNTLRKVFHTMNHFMVWMWKMGWGKALNIWPAGFGRIMVIKHKGRKSGKEYLTSINHHHLGETPTPFIIVQINAYRRVSPKSDDSTAQFASQI